MGVLRSPTIVLLSISPFISVNISFVYLGVPLLGSYMFMNVISSSCIDICVFTNAILCLIFKYA